MRRRAERALGRSCGWRDGRSPARNRGRRRDGAGLSRCAGCRRRRSSGRARLRGGRRTRRLRAQLRGGARLRRDRRSALRCCRGRCNAGLRRRGRRLGRSRRRRQSLGWRGGGLGRRNGRGARCRCGRRSRLAGRARRRRPGRGRLAGRRRHIGSRTRHGRRLAAGLRRGHGGWLRSRSTRSGLHLRRARRLRRTGRHRPLRARLAGLPRALARAGLIVARRRRLRDLETSLCGNLTDIRKDQGRQDRSGQQPAFHAHRSIRVSFHHAVSGRQGPEPAMKRKRRESGRNQALGLRG